MPRGVARGRDPWPDTIGMLAMDEEERAEWGRKNQRPYVSTVGGFLWSFVAAYGRVEPFSTLLLTKPGTDEQAAALDAYYDDVAEDKINFGTTQDRDELGLLVVLGRCSNAQRARLAYAYRFKLQMLGAL